MTGRRSYDNWQGYPTEREALLQHVKRIDDVIFIRYEVDRGQRSIKGVDGPPAS